MFQQLSLFEPDSYDNERCFHRNIRESGFDYQEVDIGDITFKTGQVVRWWKEYVLKDLVIC
jgi:hypothetical protein